MLTFLARRILLMVPVLLIVSLFSFGILHLIPGDPVDIIAGGEASREVRDRLREQLGLNDPLYRQYFRWVSHVVQGDLGRSLSDRRPISQIIRQRMPVTVQLALMGFAFASAIAVPLGVVAAVGRGRLPDYGATAVALFGVSIPNFFLGIMLLILFSLKLQWLPATGYVSIWDDPVQNLKVMLMPMITAGTATAAILTRFVRSSLLEVLRQDYVRTARSKGLAERVVIFRHALRNSLIPVITVSGLQVAGLLGGLVITETIFTLPGFGRLIVESIFNRDFPAVQGAVLFVGLVVVTVNLLVDIIYALVDPRIKLSAGRDS